MGDMQRPPRAHVVSTNTNRGRPATRWEHLTESLAQQDIRDGVEVSHRRLQQKRPVLKKDPDTVSRGEKKSRR